MKPIKLPDNGIKFQSGERCSIAGWGHTSYDGVLEDNLQEVTVELVSLNRCNSQKSYNGTVHDRALCAGYDEGGRDACQYDSGGPLSCKKPGTNTWYLIGLVSWGDECALPYKYGVYSNVTVLTPWIRSTIKTRNNVFNRIG